jgi:ABC-type multidrug transport system fused ATPase/permease subunit
MWRSWGAFLTQEEGVKPKTPTLTLFKRIYIYAKPYRIWVVLSLLSYALQAGLALIPPVSSRKIFILFGYFETNKNLSFFVEMVITAHIKSSH